MSERIELGTTGLHVSPVCYGSWQLSPRFWGDQPRDEHIQAMRTAFDFGVNFYDTAGAYGDGLSESIMGEALKVLPRDQIVIATKVYHHFYPDGHRHPDLSKKYIIEECDHFLRRLQTDYVDLLQCHAFDPITSPEETTEALELLIKQGKIRAYGVSNFLPDQIKLFRRYGNYATLQPLYNLLETGAEKDLLPYCLREKMGVLVYSPLAKGLLTGKYSGAEKFNDFRANLPHFSGEQFVTLANKVKQLQPIAEQYRLNILQLVLAATLTHPAIHCVIAGIKNSQQIKEAAGAMGQTVSREDYFKIRTILGS